MIYSENERAVVKVLKEKSPLHATEINSRLENKQSVTSTLRRLLDKKIVTRKTSNRSGREVVWGLTPLSAEGI